ncbi:FMO5-like protein [Mya arenaria]|uniref:Flavin-containing monooxygenase n=1 Tax=Mya arenaria TaxID=6604 RepID=A0ABY7EVW8_MYAAR|nr:FMO5-like protein [Mya arenaria]
MAKKRVRGASVLTAIKCCVDEGLEPVCIERSSYIGGLWHYTSEVEEGHASIAVVAFGGVPYEIIIFPHQACVMKSTVINTKEMMCYSDFPIPAEFSIYMHNTRVDKYLNMYADEFGIKTYIQFNREVYLSTRSGAWIFSGVEDGDPFDMRVNTRFVMAQRKI